MLQGDPSATLLYFHYSPDGMLPSDLDGPPPPVGSPNYFLAPGPGSSQLQEFKFHVDFSNPPNSTFSGPTIIPVPAFNEVICMGVYRSACVDQPNTTVKLETASFPLMYRLQYRN